MTKNQPLPPMHPASAMDFLPPDQLRDVQLTRLQFMVRRAYDHVPLYRRRLEERKLKPDDLLSLADINKLPFTVKTDLRDAYPFGLFASPMQEIVRFHASSGTTGKPIVVAYTQEDVDVWARAMLRSFAACGVHAGDIIQNAYGYGLFTGGLGAHYGAEALGASGHSHFRRQHRPPDHGDEGFRRDGDLLHAQLLPAPHRAGGRNGHRPQGIAVARRRIRRRTVDGRHAATHRSRKRHQGLRHLRSVRDHRSRRGHGMSASDRACTFSRIMFYPEIIDPETGEPLPDGAEGELVLTTLCKRAMPMIRYRTRDITSLVTDTCPCGRTLRRICRIGRRSDDMFIIRGVNVFPSPDRDGAARGRGHPAALPDHPDRRQGTGHRSRCRSK